MGLILPILHSITLSKALLAFICNFYAPAPSMGRNILILRSSDRMMLLLLLSIAVKPKKPSFLPLTQPLPPPKTMGQLEMKTPHGRGTRAGPKQWESKEQRFVPRKFCSCRVIIRHQYNIGLVSWERGEQVRVGGELGTWGLSLTTGSTSQRTSKWQANLHWITAFTSILSLTGADNPQREFLPCFWQATASELPELEAASGPSGLTPLKWGWNRANKHLWSFFISVCLTEFHSLQLQFPSWGERRQSAKAIPPPRAEC